jgi:hypothetical protein
MFVYISTTLKVFHIKVIERNEICIVWHVPASRTMSVLGELLEVEFALNVK